MEFGDCGQARWVGRNLKSVSREWQSVSDRGMFVTDGELLVEDIQFAQVANQVGNVSKARKRQRRIEVGETLGSLIA